jgi:hypothetical protein
MDGADTVTAAEPGLAQRRILQGMSAERVQRLQTLVELKKLYRNVIRAEALLALPSPVYIAPEGEWGQSKQAFTPVVASI